MKEQLKDVTQNLITCRPWYFILFKKRDRNLMKLFKGDSVKIMLSGSFQRLCKIHSEGYMRKFH